MTRKHIIYVAGLFFFLCNGGVQAQKGWQVGLRVTPMATWLHNSTDAARPKDSLDYVQSYGVSAGLAFGYCFNNHIGVMANVLYSSEGQNHTYLLPTPAGGKLDTVLTELRLRYIKVPLLFKINTNAERKYVLAAEIGPQFSFMTSCDERDNGKRYQYPSPPYTYFTNMPNRYSTFNIFNMGAVLGVGLDVKLRFNLKMNVQARMDYAFLNVENQDAKFDVTEKGITREVNYYNYTPNIHPNYTQERAYIQGRAASRPMTLGFSIGFTYVFIPNFHYNNQ